MKREAGERAIVRINIRTNERRERPHTLSSLSELSIEPECCSCCSRCRVSHVFVHSIHTIFWKPFTSFSHCVERGWTNHPTNERTYERTTCTTHHTQNKGEKRKIHKIVFGMYGKPIFFIVRPICHRKRLCAELGTWLNVGVSVSVVASALLLLLPLLLVSLLLMSFVRCAVGRWFFYFILFSAGFFSLYFLLLHSRVLCAF